MKNKYDSFEILTDFDNLYHAHESCRKGKRWKDSVAIYDVRGLECTLKVKELLQSGEYKLSPYNCFKVCERGKTRDIKSIKYHDRVVQKCLMDNIISPVVEPTFMDGNCASQKGKGTDRAIWGLKDAMRRYIREHGTDGYILMCDMKGYFGSIPHALLNDFYAQHYDDEQILKLIYHIHASIPGGVGVPLGNQLSQTDALIALSPLDHMIHEKWHFNKNDRYMDDFWIIDQSKERLQQARDEIDRYVTEHGMKLNRKKTRIVTLKEGVDYLGFRFYATETGKVVQKLSNKSIKHHKQKLRKMKKLLQEGKITFQACVDAHEGWKAHAQRGKKKRDKNGKPIPRTPKRARADTYYLVRKMDALFAELFADEIKKLQTEKGVKPNGKETIQPAGGCAYQGYGNDIQRGADCMAHPGART